MVDNGFYLLPLNERYTVSKPQMVIDTTLDSHTGCELW
jgi:hypothetical protein